MRRPMAANRDRRPQRRRDSGKSFRHRSAALSLTLLWPAGVDADASGPSWLAITSLNLPVVTLHLRARNKGFVLNHPIPLPLHAYFDAFDGQGSLPTLPKCPLAQRLRTCLQPLRHQCAHLHEHFLARTLHAHSLR